MSRFLSSFDTSSYRHIFLRGVSNLCQHGPPNSQTQHSFGQSALVEVEKSRSTPPANFVSYNDCHPRLLVERPAFSSKEKREHPLPKSMQLYKTLATNKKMKWKQARFHYSPEKSCHISKENILEVVAMLDESSTVEKFCEQYDHMKTMKGELDNKSTPKSLLILDKNKSSTSLSTYVRDVDNQFQLLAKGRNENEITDSGPSKNCYEDLEKFEHALTTMFQEMKDFAFRYSSENEERTVSDAFYFQQQEPQLLVRTHDSCEVDSFFDGGDPLISYSSKFSDVSDSGVLKSEHVKFRTSNRTADKDKDQRDNRPNRFQLEKVQNYFVERLPSILEEPFDYSVYTDDVILVNEWVDHPYTKRGLSSVQFELWKLKMWINIKFKSASVHVLNCVINENTATVKIRWRITGQSKLNLFKKTGQSSSGGQSRKDLESEWHDGVSTLYVNGNGVVYKHVIDKMDKETHAPKIRNTLKGKVAAALGLAGAGAFDEI